LLQSILGYTEQISVILHTESILKHLIPGVAFEERKLTFDIQEHSITRTIPFLIIPNATVEPSMFPRNGLQNKALVTNDDSR